MKVELSSAPLINTELLNFLNLICYISILFLPLYSKYGVIISQGQTRYYVRDLQVIFIEIIIISSILFIYQIIIYFTNSELRPDLPYIILFIMNLGISIELIVILLNESGEVLTGGYFIVYLVILNILVIIQLIKYIRWSFFIKKRSINLSALIFYSLSFLIIIILLLSNWKGFLIGISLSMIFIYDSRKSRVFLPTVFKQN
ncbi:MAG: hypothetical protein INQ03_05165 [Candidatus Heimdallarchaeota archaeon]|nr:hypothetical protein [Candidatus Heimdallarchaeota archaeon]